MDFDKKYITNCPEETQKFGKKFADYLIKKEKARNIPNIVCLYGDLGSGKTVFVQGVASGLGIAKRLLSPTFIIVRRYKIGNIYQYLYHLDLYRMKSSKSLQSIGISEIINNPDFLVFIEWADRLDRFLPKKRIDIHLSVLKNEHHSIKVRLT
ncbi:tRNA (adenosine(37)-N6)-threonylcarbamoyltransferase complex ATPase subunit type 1 TsaE [Patescibacteria group bacterium]